MMEFKLPKPVSAYRCPNCGGKVEKALVEDDPGCVHLVQWTCRGVNCYKTFGPPWTERLWEESDPPTLLVGMEPWYKPGESAELVLALTQAMLNRKPTSSETLRWAAEAVVALSIGGVVFVVMLHELLSQTARAMANTLI